MENKEQTKLINAYTLGSHIAIVLLNSAKREKRTLEDKKDFENSVSKINELNSFFNPHCRVRDVSY